MISAPKNVEIPERLPRLQKAIARSDEKDTNLASRLPQMAMHARPPSNLRIGKRFTTIDSLRSRTIDKIEESLPVSQHESDTAVLYWRNRCKDDTNCSHLMRDAFKSAKRKAGVLLTRADVLRKRQLGRKIERSLLGGYCLWLQCTGLFARRTWLKCRKLETTMNP